MECGEDSDGNRKNGESDDGHDDSFVEIKGARNVI